MKINGIVSTGIGKTRDRWWPVSIATCGRLGYFPVAPGTLGAAVGLVPVVLIGRLGVSPVRQSLVLGVTAAVIFAVGVGAATRAEKFFGRTDPGHVVIDEVVGQMVTFLAMPGAGWKLILAGFVLFRAFDVVKPFPARRAEHLPGGWGIMTDDVVAGVYSLLALALLGYVLK